MLEFIGNNWFKSFVGVVEDLPNPKSFVPLRGICVGYYAEDLITFPMSDLLFFFQAEDVIRDVAVTGVQTCALPICGGNDQS